MRPPVLVTLDQVVMGASQLVGLAVLAATLAAVIAVSYRWYSRERVPVGLALLVGLAGVAVYLNTTTALGRVIDGEMDTIEVALFNIAAFAFGVGGAIGGHRVGDAFGRDVLNGDHREAVDEEVSRLVKTVGRVTVVDVPEAVGDVVGYDAVSEQTREAIEGRQFVFPRNLTVSELERRIVSRLKTDFGVGTVDIELADDGTIEQLAVGSRAAGIGPTLPPATNAVALKADPAFAASTGDVVQVWETDPMRRVLTGELRGVADDVVTVAINSADTPKVDPTRRYRLVTLPVEDRPAREFASLLRAADETYTSTEVAAGSPLHGLPVGALDITVVGVKPEESEPVSRPKRDYVLSPGELIFAIGVPERLRKLEQAGTALDPSIVPEASTQSDESSRGLPYESQEDTGVASKGGSSTEQGGSAGESPIAVGDTQSDADESFSEGSSPAEETEPQIGGRADASSFDELKAEYDDGEEWSDDEDDTDKEPIEQVAGSSDSGESESSAESPSGTSFEDLKSEFESGEADWAQDDTEDDTKADGTPSDTGADGTPSDTEVAFESEDDTDDEDESDLVSLEDAEINFDDDESDDDLGGGFDDALDDEFDDNLEDNGLSSMDSESDDISSLSLDEGGDDGLFDEDSFDDDDLFAEDEDPFESAEQESDSGASETDGDEEDEDGKDEDEENETDGEDDDGGGGTSFAQLKEEFESGEADWEDDISDSPGGDMRLDE